MFVDGVALEEVFETSDGLFWVTALVGIDTDHIILSEFSMYPATSAREEIGTKPLREVLRRIKDDAHEQGIVYFTLSGERLYWDGRRRIIYMTGRVR